MEPVLLDSSVYITALRGGDWEVVKLRFRAPDTPVWLSAVVLEELYAGALLKQRRVVERLEHDFRSAGRILVPNLGDWTETGRVLARMAARYGFEPIGRARLTNDALLAISAARRGFTLLTANQRDFARLAEFRAFRWEVL